jgi:hypothetical protein
MRSDDLQTETLMLDTIAPGQRAETLKWYVQFPQHLSVEEINSTLKVKTGAVIYKELAMSSKINFGFCRRLELQKSKYDWIC